MRDKRERLPGWGYRAGAHSPEATSSCQLSSIRPPPPSRTPAIPLKVEPRLGKWILPSTIRKVPLAVPHGLVIANVPSRFRTQVAPAKSKPRSGAFYTRLPSHLPTISSMSEMGLAGGIPAHPAARTSNSKILTAFGLPIGLAPLAIE